MIIKTVNNLGTILYTIFFGKGIGQDEFGNRYFISKKQPFKKWLRLERPLTADLPLACSMVS